MGKVTLDMAMSLDGFIAGPNDEDGGLHTYFFSPSRATAEVIEEGFKTTGAIIMGRRSYNIGAEQDGFVDNPYKVPHFVLSHHVPEKVAKGAETFIFVTDGIESALQQARAAAGGKNVVVGGGANTAQQFMKAGFIDEVQLHLVPKLLGQGIRLFDYIGSKVIALERTKVIDAPDVIHISFRVVR
ncbi:MAG: dihydrofolate reductase family protein [Nitrososphaera sp.]|nr:dihydrofolate reductase family protein [Nitrososphaera sp.]